MGECDFKFSVSDLRRNSPLARHIFSYAASETTALIEVIVMVKKKQFNTEESRFLLLLKLKKPGIALQLCKHFQFC